MLVGIMIGFVLGGLLGMWSNASYRRILKMKAEDQTPEKIGDNFYYLVEEGEYVRAQGYRRRERGGI